MSISAAYAPESIKVTDDAGQPVDAVTLRVGESRNLKVTVLPDAASQEFAASAASPDIAVVGDAKPTGITVSPESLTLRVGETASLDVGVLPAYAGRSIRHPSRMRVSHQSDNSKEQYHANNNSV